MLQMGKMMKIKLRKAIILTAVIAAVGAAGMFVYGDKLVSADRSSDTIVSLRNFVPGSLVSYEIFKDGKTLGKGKKSLGQDGELKLSVPVAEKDEDKSILTYNMMVSHPQQQVSSETPSSMSMMLKVNQETGEVTYSGSGLQEFSDVSISDGKTKKEGSADWAGIFAGTEVPDNLDDKNKRLLQLAFNDYNLQNDANNNSSPVIEVIFGDSSGSSAAAVQARWTRALAFMTEEFSAVMMQQAQILGSFFDAKFQLETQRKMQELMARAHKDYHPSEQICRLGTFVKSLAHSERQYENEIRAFNEALMNQMLAVQNDSAAEGYKTEYRAKLDQFTTTHCYPRDNNDGLDLLCDGLTAAGAPARERFNKDINFFLTLEKPLTVDVNMLDGTLTPDEEDLLALAQNLYFPDVFEEAIDERLSIDVRSHYKTRSFAARMNVAHNSFVNIVGMKSSAPEGQTTAAYGAWPANIIPPTVTTLDEDTGWTFMKAFIRELAPAWTDDQIHEYLGERPSYYAQMDVLTKKIYQSPHFYTNLYDKPANVDRIGAALDAIALMSMRDRFDSSLRREMLTAMLVEDALDEHVEGLTVRIFKNIQEEQIMLNP